MLKTILILHGWGLSGERYKDLQNILEKKGYQVFAPDFPGFGSQPLSKPSMTIDDYVAFVYQFYKKHNIKKAYIIAHSFGGRVTAKFAAKYPEMIEKIVFTGSPLIRQKLSLKKRLIQSAAKFGKIGIHYMPEGLYRHMQWLVYRGIGEWDYYKAKKLRKTFIHVINEDLLSYVGNIKNPVLLLWGEDDKMVPAEIGKQIAKSIPGAKFIAIAHEGHRLPYANVKEFSRHVLSFFAN